MRNNLKTEASLAKKKMVAELGQENSLHICAGLDCGRCSFVLGPLGEHNQEQPWKWKWRSQGGGNGGIDMWSCLVELEVTNLAHIG